MLNLLTTHRTRLNRDHRLELRAIVNGARVNVDPNTRRTLITVPDAETLNTAVRAGYAFDTTTDPRIYIAHKLEARRYPALQHHDLLAEILEADDERYPEMRPTLRLSIRAEGHWLRTYVTLPDPNAHANAHAWILLAATNPEGWARWLATQNALTVTALLEQARANAHARSGAA